MAAVYKVLGQSSPSATTNTDLYTVAASTQTAASTLAVCNRATSATTYRVAIRPAGAAITNAHYIAYDVSIAGSTAAYITIGVTLATTDVVTVYAAAAQLSFSLFGVENP